MPRNNAFSIPLTGGVDLDGKPFEIAENSLRKLQNLIPDKSGFPVRRPSMQALYPLATNAGGGAITNVNLHNSTDLNPAANVTTNAIWMSTPPFDGGFFVYATALDMERFDLVVSAAYPQGQGAKAINLLPDSMPGLLPSTFARNAVQYILYGPNPYSAGVKISRAEDDTISVTDFSFTGLENENLKPRLVTGHLERYWYGNLGDEEDLPITIVVSDIGEPLVVGDAAITDRSFVLDAKGERLTALHSVLVEGQGSPGQAVLIALCNRSAHLLTGEPAETDDIVDNVQGSMLVSRISSNAGCVSQHSIADTKWGPVWCGPDDIWFMPFNSVPLSIGRKLEPLLKAQPDSCRFRIHAVYHDGFYKLSLWSLGQGPVPTEPLGEQWWLDLRNGPPQSSEDAKWCGPMIYKPVTHIKDNRNEDSSATGTSFMTLDPRVGDDDKLLGIQYAYFPTLTGAGTYTNVLVTYEGESARDWAAFVRASLQPWDANTEYNVGDQVVVFKDSVPGTATLKPLVFVVSAVTGTALSGATEPTWASTYITDNEVTWTFLGEAICLAGMYGSEILTVLQTRETACGTRMVDKLFQGSELALFLTTAQRIELQQIVDAGYEIDTLTKDVLPVGGPILGSSIFGLAMPSFNEKIQKVALKTDNGNRIVGSTVQHQFSEVSGITLPEDPTFEVLLDAVSYPVTLPESWYATVTLLAEAMVTAMTDQLLAQRPLGFILNSAYALIEIDGVGADFAASIATDSSRLIWSLIGVTVFDGVEAPVLTGTEIASDVQLGNIGYAESTVLFRPFNRRPE